MIRTSGSARSHPSSRQLSSRDPTSPSSDAVQSAGLQSPSADSDSQPKQESPGTLIADTVTGLARLGFGELSNPKTAEWIARVLLFARMRRLCRTDLCELRDSCVPLWKALFDFGNQQLPHVGEIPRMEITFPSGPTTTVHETLWIDSWQTLCRAGYYTPVALELIEKLAKWAAHRNLMEEWFLDAVVRRTTAWCSFPDTGVELAWGLPASMFCGHNHRFGSVDPNLQRLVKALAKARAQSHRPLLHITR